MENTKFKVGDMVRVKTLKELLQDELVELNDRRDIECYYDSNIFTKEMLAYCNKILEVRLIGDDWYFLAEPNCIEDISFIFGDWMFEPATPKSNTDMTKEIEDLQKAVWYINREIEMLKQLQPIVDKKENKE